MLGGVSQQPPLQRLESQCEEMVNCIPSLTEFLKRRNGARLVGNLETINTDNLFIDFIIRGDNDAGIVTVDKAGNVTVYNLDGKKIGQTQNSYLVSSNPKDDIKLCTVRDYNFLLNTKKTVKEEDVITPTKDVIQKAIIFIKQANYNQTYKVRVNAGEISYTTPMTDNNGTYTLSAANIAKELADLINNAEDIEERYVYKCSGWEGTAGMTAGMSPRPPHYTAYNTEKSENTLCYTYMSESYDGGNGGGHFYEADCAGRLTFLGYIYSNDYVLMGGFSNDAVYVENGKSYPIYKNRKVHGRANASASYFQSVIIVETRNSPLSVSIPDTVYDPYISVITNKVNSISELPIVCQDGWYIKVLGDVAQNADDYYIEFVCEDENVNIGKGGWKEVAEINSRNFPTNTTMPVVLKINTYNITVETIDWKGRLAGDKETNPSPSFVGKTIKDIFFYNNRLGFITDDSVIMSEAGEYFNFYQTTALALLDSDPIDVAISGTKVSSLKYVVPYAEGLFLYSDRSLYVLEYGDVLSTANVELKPILQFDTSLSAEPVVCDTSIYYAGKKGSYNQIREYKPTDQSDQYGYSNDITSHIPKYITGNVRKMCISLEDGIMFLINETNEVFCYSFIRDNGELLLSSWHKWTFTHPVLMGSLFQGYLYLVFKKEDNSLYLGKVAVSDVDTLYYDETGTRSDYISSYTYSPYYLRDSNGRVQDYPTMIRTMALKYSSGSEFKIVIDRKARKQEVRYTDKKRDFTRFLAASENKDVKIKIESVDDKPFNIIETDLEVVYASRS